MAERIEITLEKKVYVKPEKVVDEDVDEDVTIEVAYIAHIGHAALVEYRDEDNNLRRVSIPRRKLPDNHKVPFTELERGIPCGIPWADHLVPSATAETIETALHNQGIWQPEDALRNPQAVLSALQIAYGVDLAAILSAARELSKEDDNGR